jgi:hypothetical protein
VASPPLGSSRQSTRPVIFLHVGAAKSGTTYLQNVLWHNRDRLRDEGFHYPGDDPAAHVRAAFDLRRTFFRGASDPHTRGAWRDLVDRARDWPGTTIISQELFAPAAPVYIRQAMADLDFAEVHLVFTARDLARQIPAHWQEDIKNRFTVPFAEFMAVLKRPEWATYEIARLFWGLQDPVAVLSRWGRSLPPERVHVVTLPRPGAPRDLLWKRFCEAIGLAPDSCDLSGSFSNPSLGLAETQVLLRVNEALDERVGWHIYNDEVKLYLAQKVLTQRPDPIKIELPPEDRAWAAERAARSVADLRTAGYHVVGDLDELIPSAEAAPGREPGPHPDEPRWTEMADVGTDAIAALLRRIMQREEQASRVPGAEESLRDRVELLRAETMAMAELTGQMAHDATPLVERAARNVHERYPQVRRLRGAYQRIQALAGRSDDESKTR